MGSNWKTHETVSAKSHLFSLSCRLLSAHIYINTQTSGPKQRYSLQTWEPVLWDTYSNSRTVWDTYRPIGPHLLSVKKLAELHCGYLGKRIILLIIIIYYIDRIHL